MRLQRSARAGAVSMICALALIASAWLAYATSAPAGTGAYPGTTTTTKVPKTTTTKVPKTTTTVPKTTTTVPKTTTTVPKTTTTTVPKTTTTVKKAKEGCSPGFWKNNTGAWVGYSPDTTLGSVFDNVPATLADATFLDALNFKGNVGSEGRLLRQGVAALLNAANPDVDFTLTEAEVIDSVSDALAGTATDEETVKDELDRLNNQGCPLSADEARNNR